MSNKEKCKEAMAKFFGPSTAKLVEDMDEAECIAKCRQKVQGLLGAAKTTEFDNMFK